MIKTATCHREAVELEGTQGAWQSFIIFPGKRSRWRVPWVTSQCTVEQVAIAVEQIVGEPRGWLLLARARKCGIHHVLLWDVGEMQRLQTEEEHVVVAVTMDRTTDDDTGC